MVDDARVLLVEDVLRASAVYQPGPSGVSIRQQTVWRYQYGNHLGTVGIELDGDENIITYEENHVYGTTAFRVHDPRHGAPAKRYRYTGMERDDESDLSLHGVRYLALSIGRFLSPDAAPPEEGGVNRYAYAQCAPVVFRDGLGKAPVPGLQTGTSAPAPPGWIPTGIPVQYVEDEIWEMTLDAPWGPHYVGPYDKLTAFLKRAGIKADAHHIVGGEHLKDVGSSLSYEKAPAIALDPRIHERIVTPRIAAAQREMGGRRGGRPVVTVGEISAMYREVYRDVGAKGLARVAGRILRLGLQAGAVAGVVSELYAPVAAAEEFDAMIDEIEEGVAKPLALYNLNMNKRLGQDELVAIQMEGAVYAFDPRKEGPAALYRIITDPVEAAELHVKVGAMRKVTDFYWQAHEGVWRTSFSEGEDVGGPFEDFRGGQGWIDVLAGVYSLNASRRDGPPGPWWWPFW
jgi:RHS repeat-associated protein